MEVWTQWLNAECADQPQIYAARLVKLYEANGVTIMDWRSGEI
jgi:hypothetical protein